MSHTINRPERWAARLASSGRRLPGPPTPERCVEAYYLQRTRFERIAERKLRHRQLAEDGNVEITGRDLREDSPAAPRSMQAWQ